jgi:hypothetical protein
VEDARNISFRTVRKVETLRERERERFRRLSISELHYERVGCSKFRECRSRYVEMLAYVETSLHSNVKVDCQ